MKKKNVALLLSIPLLLLQCLTLFLQYSLNYNPNSKKGWSMFYFTSSDEDLKFKFNTKDYNFSEKEHIIGSKDQNSSVLWKEDNQCNKYKIGFGDGFKLSYLVSFPGSGNTWTRYLIEAATGIFTGSVYNDTTLYKLGFLGEKEKPSSGKTITVKTHGGTWEYPSIISHTLVPVILLIRHIETATLSFWNHRAIHSHTAKPSKSSYQTKDFHFFVPYSSAVWTRTNTEALETCKNLLVIFYEDLQKDVIQEVKKILKFLNFEPDFKRLKCLRKYFKGPAKRPSVEKVDPFTPKEKLQMMKDMEIILNILEKLNIEAPSEYYTFVNTTNQNFKFSYK
ncbi:UNVERIFIED_CONTAM: hypothetical protein RMT77_000909 [Armadillidium vulgare]